MYYLGIDGGGTKTSFLLINEIDYSISSALLPSCSVAQYGLDGFRAIITEGTSLVLTDAKTKLTEIKSVCIGVPCFTESLDVDVQILDIVNDIFGDIPCKCVNDVEVGWAGSLGLKPGINIVAGTGAIAFGRDIYGNTARSSGWGEFVGDEGSSYWLGKLALEYFSKQSDGRMPKGALYDLMKKHFGIERDLDLINYCDTNLSMKRDKVAKLQIVLCDAALAGDETAIMAYKLAANELVLSITTVMNELKFSGKSVTVSYSGGVFKAGDLILKPLKNKLLTINMNLLLKPPVLGPVSGAVLLAAEYAGETDTIAIMHYLKINEKK